jgi:hypothetical protein
LGFAVDRPGIGTQQPGRIHYEIRWTIPNEVCTKSSSTHPILRIIQSVEVFAQSKNSPDHIQIVSLIPIRSEQANSSGHRSARIAIFEFPIQKVICYIPNGFQPFNSKPSKPVASSESDG